RPGCRPGVPRRKSQTHRKFPARLPDLNLAFINTRLVHGGSGELPKRGRLAPKGASPLSPDSLASGGLQPPRAAHLPPLEQSSMSCGGGTLLGVSQWESEKEGISFGGAGRMNAAT